MLRLWNIFPDQFAGEMLREVYSPVAMKEGHVYVVLTDVSTKMNFFNKKYPNV
jgi:hypothetical protein